MANNSSIERQKGLTTNHLHIQLDPFASEQTCISIGPYWWLMIGVLGHDSALVRLMRWILLWIMPLVLDQSLNLLTSSPLLIHISLHSQLKLKDQLKGSNPNSTAKNFTNPWIYTQRLQRLSSTSDCHTQRPWVRYFTKVTNGAWIHTVPGKGHTTPTHSLVLDIKYRTTGPFFDTFEVSF